MDTLTDPVQVQSQAPIKGPLRGLHTRMTPERSKQLLQRRHELKAERLKAGQEREQLLHKLADIASRTEPTTAPVNVKPDSFVSVSLARCREQLDRLYEKLNNSELTPAEIDKIASAIAKFSEIERGLAMRPGPGVIKQGESKAQTRAGWLLGGQDEPIPNKTPLNSDPVPFVPGQAPEPGKAEQE